MPLWQHVLAGNRLYDLFTDDDHTPGQPRAAPAGPAGRLASSARPRAARAGAGSGPRRFPLAYRPEVIARLDASGLLPAITFIFSRAGCDAAVQQCLAGGPAADHARERRR